MSFSLVLKINLEFYSQYIDGILASLINKEGLMNQVSSLSLKWEKKNYMENWI
jgi:hypothetical protein